MRHGVHTQRAGRVPRQCFPPQRLGVRCVAVFGVRERRDGQQELETALITRPRRHYRIDDRAKPVVPTQEEVARLREPQRQQIARPPVQDERIAFSGEDRVPG